MYSKLKKMGMLGLGTVCFSIIAMSAIESNEAKSAGRRLLTLGRQALNTIRGKSLSLNITSRGAASNISRASVSRSPSSGGVRLSSSTQNQASHSGGATGVTRTSSSVSSKSYPGPKNEGPILAAARKVTEFNVNGAKQTIQTHTTGGGTSTNNSSIVSTTTSVRGANGKIIRQDYTEKNSTSGDTVYSKRTVYDQNGNKRKEKIKTGDVSDTRTFDETGNTTSVKRKETTSGGVIKREIYGQDGFLTEESNETPTGITTRTVYGSDGSVKLKSIQTKEVSNSYTLVENIFENGETKGRRVVINSDGSKEEVTTKGIVNSSNIVHKKEHRADGTVVDTYYDNKGNETLSKMTLVNGNEIESSSV